MSTELMRLLPCRSMIMQAVQHKAGPSGHVHAYRIHVPPSNSVSTFPCFYKPSLDIVLA